MKSIRAFYPDVATATEAVRALNEAHMESDQILVFDLRDGQPRPLPIETRVGDVRGSIYGGIAGLVIGALGAWLAEIGVLVDPGIGFIADTAFVTVLRFLFMGAGTGALTGYIVGLAIWRVEIRAPKGLEGLVIHIRTSDRRLEAMTSILESAGADRLEVGELP